MFTLLHTPAGNARNLYQIINMKKTLVDRKRPNPVTDVDAVFFPLLPVLERMIHDTLLTFFCHRYV